MNLRAQRNIAYRQSIPGENVRVFTARDHLAHFQPYGSDDVALLAVEVGDQGDIRRAIRIIFDLRHTSRHAILVALKINYAIETLMSAAPTPHRDMPIVVASRDPYFRFEQRLFRHSTRR